MVTRISSFLLFITFCAIIWPGTYTVLAQKSVAEFHKVLREKADLSETDFAALAQGQTVVKLLPEQDKREVAVCGVVSLHGPAEMFLQSYRESMAKKTNPAILEIGSFSGTPTLADLQTLTIEDRDIEDLKECVVGDCKLKLSATMIERFRNEVSWDSPDYRIQAAQLLKQMLLDYVRDYLARGDAALIAYNDKPKEVRLAEEQRALMAGSSYINDVLAQLPPHLKSFPLPERHLVENAIVWSKIKFGLKPVIAINHIMIYKREQETVAQVLIASKQIYANHYFDSALALTAFVNVPGSTPGAYLFYENRTRADGLGGAFFSKIKRGIVEKKAVAALTAILEQSKVNLNARALGHTESAASLDGKRSWKVWKTWRGWTVGGVHLFFWLFIITALVGLLTLGTYDWRGGFSRGAHD